MSKRARDLPEDTGANVPLTAPQVSTASYLDNRMAALEADMRQLQMTYTAREAALAELKAMREAVVE